jgi:hypothetical protein
MSNWTVTPPTEPGDYWFYGDFIVGQMGVDFTDEYKWEPELYLVRVRKGTNCLIGVTNGHFMQLRKFDRSDNREGHIGYWMEAQLPPTPCPGCGRSELHKACPAHGTPYYMSGAPLPDDYAPAENG